MKSISVLLLLSMSYSAFTQKEVKKDCLEGLYYFYNDDSLVRHILKLEGNRHYRYEITEDLITKKSTGKWDLIKDTLLLTSKYQIDSIDLQVNEYIGPGNEAEIKEVKNMVGQILPTAIVYINNDTTKIFDPLTGKSKYSKGSIQTLNVLVGRATSTTYKIKNPKATKFFITLRIDNHINNYLFLKQSKYLIRNDRIYPLKNNKIDSTIVNMNVMIPFALKKD